MDMWLLQSSVQQISPNLKEHCFPGFPNTEKNIREAVCIGGQKEGTLENKKRCGFKTWRGTGLELDLLRVSNNLSGFLQFSSELY